MHISIPVKTILRPSTLSMIAVGASLTAWLFPSFGVLRKGFENPETLTVGSFLTLFAWYTMIFISFLLGEKLGGLAVPRERLRPLLPSLESNAVYYGFTLIAAIGMGTMLAKIFHDMSLMQALVFITLGQTNALKDTIYENYSVGFVSLRYLVLFPASIALYRLIRLKQYSIINFFNVLLLGMGVFLSSRLMLMAALVVTYFLVTFGKRTQKVSVPKVTGFVLFLFLLLGVLNLSRNANYYGNSNQSFGTAGASEILAYLGSPFQVAIGTAKVTDKLAVGLGDEYRDYVDVEINLNTNSAFTLLLIQMGYKSWPYIALTCLVMGFLFEAMASLGRTMYLLPCGAILYASAELWRLDLYQQGTFIIWFVFGTGVPTLLIAIRVLRKYLGSASLHDSRRLIHEK